MTNITFDVSRIELPLQQLCYLGTDDMELSVLILI